MGHDKISTPYDPMVIGDSQRRNKNEEQGYLFNFFSF